MTNLAYDNLMRDLFGGDTASTIQATLRCAEIAEEEIEKAYPRQNGGPTDPPGLFAACQPHSGFFGKIEGLYRHHVREMIARSRDKGRKNYVLGTEVEVLLGMVETSLTAPLTQEGMLLYSRLFEKIVGKKMTLKEDMKEQWEGQYEQILSEARRKVRARAQR